jgi:hypothetical protein
MFRNLTAATCLLNDDSSSVSIVNSTFDSISGSPVLYSSMSNFSMRDSKVMNNVAVGTSSCILEFVGLTFSYVVFDNTWFSDNAGQSGSAICTSTTGYIMITTCTFSGNSAYQSGGALLIASAPSGASNLTVDIKASTFAANRQNSTQITADGYYGGGMLAE